MRAETWTFTHSLTPHEKRDQASANETGEQHEAQRRYNRHRSVPPRHQMPSAGATSVPTDWKEAIERERPKA
jgi:hypothetical protein